MNNNSASNIDIKKNVLEKITSNEVKMRPRLYFILEVTGLFFVLLLTLVVSSLLISYIIFTLKVSGHLFLLGLGWKGLQAFVLLFPWSFLLADIILLIVLDWLAQKFTFAYHRPLLYLFGGSLATIFIIGYIISHTPLNVNLQQRAAKNQLSVFGGLYKGIADPNREDGIFRGVVINIKGNTFKVRHDDLDSDLDDGEETINLSQMGIQDASKLVHVGENVFIAGDRIGGVIQAYGIRQMPLEF